MNKRNLVLLYALFAGASFAQAQSIASDLNDSDCQISVKSKLTLDFKYSSRKPTRVSIDDYVVGFLTDDIGFELAEQSYESGKAAIEREQLKSTFMEYCGATDNTELQKFLKAEFKLGFGRHSIGEAATWAAAGHYLLDDDDDYALAHVFLEKASHAIQFDDYDHRSYDKDEANSDILDFQYQLIADRAYLARETGRTKDVGRNGKHYLNLIKAHQRHDQTSSEVAPELITLQILEDLSAAGFHKRAEEIIRAEFDPSFEGIGVVRYSQANLRLYNFLVTHNFNVHKGDAYIESLRHENLLIAKPPGRITNMSEWRWLRESNAERLKKLSHLLPKGHPILVRDKFYNEIYVLADDALDAVRPFNERREKGTHIWNKEKLELLSRGVARWKAEFIAMENLHTHDLAERLREIFILEHWLQTVHPDLELNPESSLEYILGNISGLHDNVEGDVRNELAKALISTPYYHDNFIRGSRERDPLYKLFNFIGCEGRNVTDLEVIHANRAIHLERLDNFKRAHALGELSYPQLRPQMQRKPAGETYDPFKLEPIINWLETDDIEILIKAFPPVRVCGPVEDE